MRTHWNAAVVMTLAALVAGDATAQAPSTSSGHGFPSKVVRIVVPFPAGGSNDVVARAMSSPLSKALGQSVVVENRPGANSMLGAELVARSPADGHTVLLAGFTMLGNTALRSKVPVHPLKDFVPVTGIGAQPMVLSVHPSLPVQSVKELIALARARPGQLVFAIPAYGGPQHISGELLKLKASIDMKYVAFQGGAPATVAVLGGHAPVLISTIPTMLQHHNAGKLRTLAVTSATRSELLKDIPTMIELGFADFDITGALGVFAPAGTPKQAVERLNAEITRVVLLPDVKDGMARDGYLVKPLGPVEFEAFLREKLEQIQKIVREAKIKID
jgi:tripartite-type tricarboxylate transporter receptor subunit TctC